MYLLVNSNFGQVQYERYETTEVKEEVEQPEWLQDADAVKAAEDVIRKKELQAELATLDAEIKDRQEKRKQVATELDSYWTREKVKTLIRRAFPEDPHTAVAVATCESGLKPTAHNPHNNNGSTDGGLWQINSVHDKKLDQLGLDKYDPEDATKFARLLYEERGFKDWVCFTKGLHLAKR